MDAWYESRLHDSIVVTGMGHEALNLSGSGAAAPCDGNASTEHAVAWLKSRKSLKFMGKQDRLAVIAAGKALRDAGIEPGTMGDRTGLFLAVGFIPFERADLETIGNASADRGQFSMRLFSTVALEQVNPLLTFRCLPNMPAYHVSANFGITGRYFVTYPGPGQLYGALEQAVFALWQKQVDVALVGGVADQNNFLVQHHLKRIGLAAGAGSIVDVAAFLCLERAEFAAARNAAPKGELRRAATMYCPPDVWNDVLAYRESMKRDGATVGLNDRGNAGAASLPFLLNCVYAMGDRGEIVHELATVDGISATSTWRFPP